MSTSVGFSTVPVKREPVLKRPLDILLASIGLFVTMPLSLLVAIAIKVTGRGPIMFRQVRWGRGGSKFVVYKFRTMHHTNEEEVIRGAMLDDERVTKVGRRLRAMGLDEIPQLVNILRGDMSLVGPRALAVGESISIDGAETQYEDLPGFAERLSVRPGLTGTATIYIPKDAPPLEKFEKDLEYVENQSLGLDVRLILLSIWISIRGRWETRTPKV